RRPLPAERRSRRPRGRGRRPARGAGPRGALRRRDDPGSAAMSAAVAELAQRLGIDAFERAGLLPWLLGAPAAAGALRLCARPAALAWPDAPLLRAAGARRVDLVRGGALALRAAALALLALALAGPVGVHVAPPEPGSGLDLVLALDASGSMRALD